MRVGWLGGARETKGIMPGVALSETWYEAAGESNSSRAGWRPARGVSYHRSDAISVASLRVNASAKS